MYNVHTRGIQTPNVIVGMAIFCGGLTQLLAGMWEFCRMNVFAVTAVTSYGAFWMSYATILIPNSGILAAYAKDPAELSSALGIFLITWFIIAFFVVSLRKSVAFVPLFAVLSLMFVLLATAELATKHSVKLHSMKAAGALGLIAALIAYYIGLLASEG